MTVEGGFARNHKKSTPGIIVVAHGSDSVIINWMQYQSALPLSHVFTGQ